MEGVERKLAFKTHLQNKASPHLKRQKHLTWLRFRVNSQRRGDKEKASKMCLQNRPSTHAQNDNSRYVNGSKDFMSQHTCPILLLLCQGHFIHFYSIPSPASRCLTHLHLLLTGLSLREPNLRFQLSTQSVQNWTQYTVFQSCSSSPSLSPSLGTSEVT